MASQTAVAAVFGLFFTNGFSNPNASVLSLTPEKLTNLATVSIIWI
jgi:hypothetical protein